MNNKICKINLMRIKKKNSITLIYLLFQIIISILKNIHKS